MHVQWAHIYLRAATALLAGHKRVNCHIFEASPVISSPAKVTGKPDKQPTPKTTVLSCLEVTSQKLQGPEQ